MSNPEKFFEQIFRERLNSIHTAMPCIVESYDEAAFAAELQPIFKRYLVDGSKQDYPLLSKVPVLEHVVSEEPLEPGDKVFVVFSERSLDEVGDRKHDMTDAVIVGRFAG